MQKTYTKDYLKGTREKNTGQRNRYYVSEDHPAIISAEDFDKVKEEMFHRARLNTNADGGQTVTGNRYSSKYLLSNLLACGNCGASYRRRTERGKIVWRCATRIEKGVEACNHSITLQDDQIKGILSNAVCNGHYDEQVIRAKVKRIDVFEKRVNISFEDSSEVYIQDLSSEA